MYEGLLLSKDGGIITDIKKSAQQGEPNIIIGLGGTGVDALRVIKKKVYEHLIPDNPDGDIPKYKHIGFLAIDTDDINTGHGETYDLERKECLNINVTNLSLKMAAAIQSGAEEFKWLQSLELLGKNDTGAVRQVGRYCLFKNIDQVTDRIRKLKADVTVSTGVSRVNVHVIAGISGGTGGGTFIDMCYIIRDLLGSDGTLFGYFFMPDVDLGKPVISANIAKHIKSNGYAALKELDYTMNLSKSGDSFSQYYGGASMYSVKETSVPLVDLCHLVSATKRNGEPIPDGYMYSMNIVGEYILSYLAEVEVDKVSSKTLVGHFANIRTLVNAISKKHGENLNYHVLGASAAELPTKEIGTYLATKLYEKLEKGLVEKEPNDSDVRRHADAMGLSFSSFKEKLWERIAAADTGIDWDSDDFTIDDVINTQIISKGTVGEDTYDSANISIRKIILDPARKWETVSRGRLQENFYKLIKDLDGFNDIGQGVNDISLISNVFKYLQNKVVSDFEYGAVYASRLTHNDHGYSLNDCLLEIIREADTEKANCELDREARARDIIEAVKDCKESAKTILKSKRREMKCIEAYKNAIRAYFQNEFDIEVFEKIKVMADNLRKQIDMHDYPDSLYHKYFKPLEDMLLELKATFRKNSEYFEAPAVRNDKITWKIAELSDIQGHLDDSFNKMFGDDASREYRSFVSMLMEQYDKWACGDRYKVEKMITSYISDMFAPVLNTSIESYLNDKYDTHGKPQVLQEKIETELLTNGVLAKAQPEFYIDDRYVVDTVEKCDLNVPIFESNICAAAQILAATQMINVRRTGIGDRISVVKFESGIPLYAYGLTDVLEREYESGGNMAIGRHLYEITDRNKDIDWASLPSVIPYSIRPQSTPNGEEIVNLYKEAESRGIIEEPPRNSYDYCVYELEMPELKGRDDFADGNEFQEYIKMLNSYRDNEGKVSPDAPMHKVHTLRNDGSIVPGTDLDYGQVCRLDYFIQFKNLQTAARNSIDILDKVDKALEETDNWIKEIINNNI